MRYSTKGWLGLAAYLAVVEYFAPPGELLSEAFDRWLTRWHTAVLAIGVTLLTAAHLLNLLPPERDPYTRLTPRRRK